MSVSTAPRPREPEPLLVVDGLTGGFRDAQGRITNVLSDVSFSIPTGSMTAVVGETGSGKSMTALSIMGLPPAGFRRTAGTVLFDGIDLSSLSPRELRPIRGAQIAMVFQDARAAMNPVFTVGKQLSDVWRAHQDATAAQARSLAVQMLERVRIPEPHRRMRQYPHEFSGGMAQRVMLAMALIAQPRLLLLDEPTTGLDVTIQADIMDLIVELTQSSSLTTVLITHDLGLVAESCDRVIVMRDGTVREIGSTEQIFDRPSDSYTRHLIEASRLVEAVA